jgi:hypothetical protein
MGKRSLARLIASLFILSTLALSFFPSGAALADDQTPMTRLTVINQSQFPFTIQLFGPEQYNLEVPAYETGFLLVLRGNYSFVMHMCNYTATSSIDLNIFQKMYVPVCGGSARAKATKHHVIDASTILKPVTIKIRNKTKEPIGLYLRTLENHYHLNLVAGEVLKITVPRDRYVYSYVACGELVAGYYNARVNIPLDLKCP